MVATIYESIYKMDQPRYRKIDLLLERIANGTSKPLIERIRQTLDNTKADALKKQLPAVCFSGQFGVGRLDQSLIQHSGFFVLDFDHIGQDELRSKQEEIINHDFVYACWVSPRGNGLKALVKIADPLKHREHFEAIKEIFPDVDKSGINESRVCFESYDPEIYINKEAVAFTRIKTIEYVRQQEIVKEELEIFKRLLTWLTNTNHAFVTGERNIFIFKLAAACCRFGLGEESVMTMIQAEYPTSNDFTSKEARATIRSAYKANRQKAGSATFVNDRLVEKSDRKEVEIDTSIMDITVRPKDVIYGEDCKDEALNIYRNGYEQVSGIGIVEIDTYFKAKRTELTLLSGIGNYGKSTFLKYFLIMRVLLYQEKYALFSPEENPAAEFYHDFVEIILGCDCTPANPNRPGESVYSAVYDWISRHIFYVYPKEVAPTPEYVKERFLELIIKEKVDGVIVDPFNQLTNDYAKVGGRSDKYLEWLLSDFARFAVANNVFFFIIAHPRQLQKDHTGNYPCPDVFDLADGAMWNNKMSNILIYHKPFQQMSPDDATCELHSKKIKKQKTVGKRGYSSFIMDRKSRRYTFSGHDPLAKLLRELGIDFKMKQSSIL